MVNIVKTIKVGEGWSAAGGSQPIFVNPPVVLNFTTPAWQVEGTAEGRTETTELPPVVGGASSGRVLLPADVGVKQESQVAVTLRQGARELKKTVKVPAMRHWTVYLYNHAHVDIGYTAP